MNTCPQRTAALVEGAQYYFTGKPCKHGHVSKRYVHGGQCFQCDKERKKPWTKTSEGRARSAAVASKWRKNNPVAYRQAMRDHRETQKGAATDLWNGVIARTKNGRIPVTITKQDIYDLLGEAMELGVIRSYVRRTPETPSLDRIEPKLGYVKGNVRIIPVWLNFAKHHWTDEQLFVAMNAAGWVRQCAN